MHSNTKNHLSNEEIKKLVKINFGNDCEASDIQELKGGMFNAIYAMNRVKEGDTIVLKVGVVPGTRLLTYEQDVMPTEVECYRLIHEQTTVPVPEILTSDLTKQHIKSNYFFMTAMEGVPLSQVSGKMKRSNLDHIKAELAGYLAQLHQIKGSYYGYFTEDPERQYGTWKEAFFQMVEMILQDGKNHHVQIPFDRIRNALKTHENLLEMQNAPSLVEYDCHEGNIFVKQTGGIYHIEGIVDFERAFWGDPAADLPAAFILTDDIRKEQAFLNAYVEASEELSLFSETEVKKYLLYRMYILTIMAAETFRYGWTYGKLQGAWAKKELDKCLQELER